MDNAAVTPPFRPRRAYLDGLTDYEPTTSWGTEDDKHERRWTAQRARYGFDDRQTWSLDTAMVELLFERLQMFLASADSVVDLEFHRFKFEGKELTQREIILELIELAKKILDGVDMGESERSAKRFWDLWAVVHPAMWW